jgi:type IV secretion system protein TrbD
MAVRQYPIHRIGGRKALLMGGDRELVLFTALLSTILIVVAQDWMAFFFGVGLWFFTLWALRKMGSSDPLMRQIYLRSLRYNKGYYSPRSTPFRVNNKSQENGYK